MTSATDDWLPPLLECDWNHYPQTIDRAYEIFSRDFEDHRTRPTFQNRRLGLKRHPELDGRCATFWHFITEGQDEANRVPVRERIERIAWPRALIVESSVVSPRVSVWMTRRKTSKRWVLAVRDFSYVVVLDDRGKYLLPWTAFNVDEDHRRQRFRSEYEVWCKNQKS